MNDMSLTFPGAVIMENVSRWVLTITLASVKTGMSSMRELGLACPNTPNVSHVGWKKRLCKTFSCIVGQ